MFIYPNIQTILESGETAYYLLGIFIVLLGSAVYGKQFSTTKKLGVSIIMGGAMILVASFYLNSYISVISFSILSLIGVLALFLGLAFIGGDK